MSPVLELASLAQEALILGLALSLPALALSALVSLIASVFQAASQIQDVTLAHLPRLIVMCVALAALAPWMGRQIAAFATRAFLGT